MQREVYHPTCSNSLESVLQGLEEISDNVKARDEGIRIDEAAFSREFLSIVLLAAGDNDIDNLQNFLRFCVRNHADSSDLSFEEAAEDLAESPRCYYFFEVGMLRNSGVEVPSHFPKTVCMNLATNVHLLCGSILD
jgi:hypothetical protein